MTSNEKILLALLAAPSLDRQMKAILLQDFIQTEGPLSKEAGAKVREILKGDK